MKLDTLQNTVLYILQNNERSRSDDFYLWGCVCSEVCGTAVMLVPFGTLAKMHKAYNVPSFESVRRTRQKLQAKYPELKDKETARLRAEKEEEYLGYARS